MKKLIRKLQGHTDQMLGCFIGLKEKYAFLEPMLFQREVVEKYSKGQKFRGFNAIKYSLFYDCVQDLTKLSLDADERTPSIKNIMDSLEKNKAVLRQLCETFSQWGNPIREDEDEDMKEALKKYQLKEQERLRTEFYNLYNKTCSDWNSFKYQKYMCGLKTIRDKLTAHLELRLVDGQYRLTDMSRLGLKWGDLPKAISEVEEIVLNLNLIVRSASFSMESLVEPLERDKKAFWD